MAYRGGTRTFKVHTPARKKMIKKLTRRSFQSAATQMLSSPSKSKHIISQVSQKIRQEMKLICSDSHDSILKDNVEAVKHFSWQTVYLELTKQVPTLMALLSQLVPKPENKKPMLCLLASQLLAARHQRMCLVQRAISVMMYGNSTAKQVGFF